MEFQPIKGTHDILEEEMDEYHYVTALFRAVAELYGYHEIITPSLEYTEVFSRGAGESSDVVRKEMYTFLDKGNRSVTLRPEFTAGVMRAIVSNKLYASSDFPLKYFYSGPAFRYERPQLGRYRQFNQFGVEAVGLDSPLLDAETILMAIQAFSMLGFNDISLKINTLGDNESRLAYKNALKEYFAKHIDNMCSDCHERLTLNPMRILDCKVSDDQEIAKGAPKMKDFISKTSDERFYKTLSILNDFSVKYEVDDSLVRGLDYYSEVVFEVHAKNKDGKDYGALCGGGHYTGLTKQFGGPDLVGVGFAVGVERIISLMKDESLFNDINSELDIYLMPIGENVIPSAMHLANDIRMLGYSVEMPFTNSKLGGYFKKAEKRNAHFGLIIGEDELARGVCQLKNLRSKEQKEVNIADLETVLDNEFGEDIYGEAHCSCHEHEGNEHCCCHKEK